jgi:hypothetical protein
MLCAWKKLYYIFLHLNLNSVTKHIDLYFFVFFWSFIYCIWYDPRYFVLTLVIWCAFEPWNKEKKIEFFYLIGLVDKFGITLPMSATFYFLDSFNNWWIKQILFIKYICYWMNLKSEKLLIYKTIRKIIHWSVKKQYKQW